MRRVIKSLEKSSRKPRRNTKLETMANGQIETDKNRWSCRDGHKLTDYVCKSFLDWKSSRNTWENGEARNFDWKMETRDPVFLQEQEIQRLALRLQEWKHQLPYFLVQSSSCLITEQGHLVLAIRCAMFRNVPQSFVQQLIWHCMDQTVHGVIK